MKYVFFVNQKYEKCDWYRNTHGRLFPLDMLFMLINFTTNKFVFLA